MTALRRWLPCMLCCWSLACAHATRTTSFHDYPTAGPAALSPKQDGPEVAALITAFYDRPFEPAQLRSQVASVLARYPHASRAHEVAAYLARLDADSATATEHFLQAASDLDSELTPLYLWELDQHVRSAREDNRLEALARALLQNHPRALVRDYARATLSSLLRSRLELEEARNVAAELHYLNDWNLIGAFDNDQGKGFLTSYPPEQTFALDQEYPGKILPVRWRNVRADDSGMITLDDWVAPNDFALSYLATFVGSDTAGPAELRITAGEAVQVWWNDALVASEETLERGGPDNLVVPVQLAKGWNKLLIKTCVKNSEWTFAARVTKPEGDAWPGLRTSSAAMPYAAVKSANKPAAISFIGSAVSSLESPGRRELLSSRYAAFSGRRKDILPPIERWTKLAPENAHARYQIALAYWRNDELGKAIDALNAGAQRHPGLPGFLLERSHYYRQKHLWDQALGDVKKIATITGERLLRDVKLELSEIYKGRGFMLDQCRELTALSEALPDLEPVHVERADCNDYLGYTERAEDALRQALALEPGDDRAVQRAIGLQLRRLDFDRALESLAQIHAKEPYALGWNMQRANIERRRGDHVAARASYEAMRAQTPDWPVVYERLADLAYEDGRAAEAMAAYQAALARNPRSAELAERVAFLDPNARGLAETLTPSEAAIDEILRDASKVNVLPGAYTVRLLDHEVAEISNDGSAKRIYTRIARAENQQGVDRLTKIDLPGSGTRKVLRAYSQSPSGERQEASSIADRSVRFRKLEPGSITVIQLVHYQPPGAFLPNHFADTRFFQSGRDQLEKASWIVVHDKARKLEVAVRGDIHQSEKDAGQRVITSFTAEHVPPVVEEPFMPPAADVLAQVSLSTLNTWEEYVRWERALLTDAFRSSPELEALAARLTQHAATPKDKLDQLFRFVANDIRYQQEYETTIAGVRPHTGPVTLERGYGDCKDKAVLLIELARLVGLHLQFALLRTTAAGQVQPAIPNQQFNHAIVYVPKEAGLGEPYFLDATADGLDIGNLRSDDQGALALVLDPEGAGHHFIPIPYEDSGLEYEKHELTVTIKSPTEASAIDRLTARGAAAAGLRMLLRNHEVADKALQRFASMLFTGSTIERRTAEHPEDVWHPLQLELELNVSSAIQNQGDNWRLPVPAFLPDTNASALASRRTPVHFGRHDSTTYRVDAQLPEGLRVVQAPASFEVEHPCFTAKRQTKVTGRRVEVTLDYTRRCANVSVADYAEFRRAALQVQKALRDEIVFAREPEKKGARAAIATPGKLQVSN